MDRQTQRLQEIEAGNAEVTRIAAAFQEAYGNEERHAAVLSALREWLRVKIKRIDAILSDPETDDECRKIVARILQEHKKANTALDASDNPFIAFYLEPSSSYLRVPLNPNDCTEGFMYGHNPSH